MQIKKGVSLCDFWLFVEMLEHSGDDLNLKLVLQTWVHQQDVEDLRLSVLARQVSDTKLRYQFKHCI